MPYKKRYNRRQNKKRNNMQTVPYRRRFITAVSKPGGMLFKLNYGASYITDVAGTLTFDRNLSSVVLTSQWASMQALFDQFAIFAMKVELFATNVGNEASVTGTVRGDLASIIDYDGGTMPTAIATMMDYGNVKLYNPRQMKIVRYVPISKMHRPALNDVASGFNSANDNVTVRFRTEAATASRTLFFTKTTYYVRFYGLR